jgi:hypothetical protein
MRVHSLLIASLLGVVSSVAHGEADPRFADCPVPVENIHTSMPRLQYGDAQSRHYKTAIREAARGPVNFAGHYVLATWGCGAGCVMAAAIDKKTGRVTSLPFTVSDWPLDVTEPLSYRADSCILVVRGSRNESAAHGTYYYGFDGKAFTFPFMRQGHE